MTLNQLRVGESAVIVAVRGEGALRNRLIDMGLIPRTKVTLRKVAPMGDPIEIHIRGYELTLRLEDAADIVVAPEDAAAMLPRAEREPVAAQSDGEAES